MFRESHTCEVEIGRTFKIPHPTQRHQQAPVDPVHFSEHHVEIIRSEGSYEVSASVNPDDADSS
jgi:hypothetical protein